VSLCSRRRTLPVIDFRRYRVRLIVAFALAIALHEILLGFLHASPPQSNHEDAGPATRIAIEIKPPTPTPAPTPPPPPPRTPPPRVTAAPVPQIAGAARGRPAKHRGGGARRAVAHAPRGVYANPHAAGAGNGSATGTGAGSTAGQGGGQNGSGAGESGNGNGAVNANAPCGVVEFIPYAAPRSDGATVYEPVQATVTFPDGHKETARFPYSWVYTDGERTDPWSQTNLRNPNFQTTLQLPPPGADRSGYPSLIQYILAHTDLGGYTDLPDCPKAGR
jgi:hypothetical protein